LELLGEATKVELGNMLASVILPREKAPSVREACLFALGRVGSRVPVYGPLDGLVPADVVEGWVQALMGAGTADERVAFTVTQLTRRTGDRYRDVSETMRREVLAWLEGLHAPAHFPELVREGGELQGQEQRAVFGESLPRGLRIA
jgi:hypothetical protein